MKLSGIRVIDLSQFLPGPYLTLSLADHGAEVIKIEPPAGDAGRRIGLSDGSQTVFFRNLNRGKKSIVLNLKDKNERQELLSLCETADVFVESFRPGVVDRLGAGYADVAARNPGIVYCSINAFGEDSPWRDHPAHDLAIEAMTGALSMTLGDDARPAIPGVPMADIAAGLQGLAGILMALYRRTQTGRGDYLEVAMFDALFAAMPNILGPVFAEDRQPDPKHERTTGGSAFYRIYDTSDGKQIVLAGQEPHFVERVLDALDRRDLIELCGRGPGPHQQPVIECLETYFAGLTQIEALAWLEKLDVCFAPVDSLLAATKSDNVARRRLLLHDQDGRKFVAPAVRFREEPAQPNLQVPGLGEHGATAREK